MKIDDYVRTRWGYICKIININEFREPSMRYSVEASYLKDIVFIGDEEIIKSSPSIIDLIEEGDYVNGHYVEGVEKVPNKEVYKVIRTSTCDGMDGETLDIYKEEIESIVTKEQFESMEYKLGE